MNKIDNKISRLEDQFEKVKAELENMNNTKREEEKKILLRKQIIIGKMVIDKMNKNENFHTKTLARLDKTLTKKIERELFSLGNFQAKPSDETSPETKLSNTESTTQVS